MPSVTIVGGGGAGAPALAHLTGDVVTSLSVNNPGNGAYSSPPTVAIAPPPANLVYTTYWSNDGSSSAGSQPTAAVSASVAGGLFTVGLGDVGLANMAGLDAALFTQTNLQLRIWFNDGANGFAALGPLQSLTPAPYANYAYSAMTLASGIKQPVNLTANGLTVLRIAVVADPSRTGNYVNILGGSPANFVTNGATGVFIGGGDASSPIKPGVILPPF